MKYFLIFIAFFLIIGSLLRLVRAFLFPTIHQPNDEDEQITYNRTTPKDKKIIQKDEGEYVDFEELKNDNQDNN